MVSQETVKRLFDYDPLTGLLRWKVRPNGSVIVGQSAGTVYSNGYIFVCIGYKKYGVHVIAWLYMYGEHAQLDHKDQNRSNNKIENLRKATYSQNNHHKYVYNPTGFRGVRFRSGKYEANIRINGRITRLGFYGTAEEASAAYNAAAKEHYGEFASEA